MMSVSFTLLLWIFEKPLLTVLRAVSQLVPAALSLPAMQSGAQTNIEQIVALTPQVVFMDTMNQSVEQIQQLEAAGIQVVVSDAVDLEGVYESISVIGKVMSREREATEVINGMKQTWTSPRGCGPCLDNGPDFPSGFSIGDIAAKKRTINPESLVTGR